MRVSVFRWSLLVDYTSSQ